MKESEREIASLDKLEPRITRILEQHRETSGNYWALMFRYFNIYYSDKVRITVKGSYDKLFELPSPESVSRICRLVLSKRMDLAPTAKTERKRARRKDLMREYFKGESL
jgi:hypothetical protein